MEIQIKQKRRHDEAFTEPFTVPVSSKMREALRRLKVEAGIDLNSMTREFFLKVIEQVDKEQFE